MECYKIENLTFKYPASDSYALRDVSLTVNPGEFVTVCGHSGSGKSTLLRLLKPTFSPKGEKTGKILFTGEDVTFFDNRAQAEKIGFIMQSPDNQIVTDKVWHELSFGLESIGADNLEIRTKVAEMASFFGIEDWFHKKTTDLSGGQKQLLNLASVMVMQPDVLILDEPTSQLDPIASGEFLNALSKINRELGVTVIISEHRLEEVLTLSDRVILLDEGSVSYIGKPCELSKKLKASKDSMLLQMPVAMRVFSALTDGNISPVTVREGKEFLRAYAKDNSFTPKETERKERNRETVLSVKDIYFRYKKNLPDVVRALDFTVSKGEFYTILGGNGSGKTTTLSLLCGINKPYRGKIKWNGNPSVGLLPQNPQTVFVEKTVEKDLWEMLSDIDISNEEKKRLLYETVELCELGNLKNRHPYDLSGGEMQRAALAKILLKNPDVILLDEPTKGIDARFKEKLAQILKKLQEKGVTLIAVSHDIEFCAKYADRCAMFFDGNIVSEDVPSVFFGGKSFYTTAANRMSRGIIDNMITAEDIISAFGKKEEYEKLPQKKKQEPPTHTVTPPERKQKESPVMKSNILLCLFTVLILMPLTAFAGMYLLEDKKYYFISLLLITEAMIPFAVSFERRKASSREIVVISVLCAIAVAGRIAFFMLPLFKPIAAIVIVTGIAFGAETGFLAGSVSAFVSNFYFGQGPWTPWQMFALAMVGFLAGLIFRKRKYAKNRVVMCFFGFVLATIVYGPISDLSALAGVNTPTWEYMLTVWGLGMPFNLIHGISTAFFLFVIGRALCEKLERIKTKYSL